MQSQFLSPANSSRPTLGNHLDGNSANHLIQPARVGQRAKGRVAQQVFQTTAPVAMRSRWARRDFRRRFMKPCQDTHHDQTPGEKGVAHFRLLSSPSAHRGVRRCK
jgi:hypothetical protein